MQDIKEIIVALSLQEYNNKTSCKALNKDDTFDFECSSCGGCCRNREVDILLNPFDLYRATNYIKSLNLDLQIGGLPVNMVSIESFINCFCDWYEGESSKLPIVTLDLSNAGTCPLLKDNRCQIQEAKPHICSLYPLGFLIDFETGEYSYYSKPTCGKGTLQKQTVKKWLKNAALLDYEDFIVMWHKQTHLICLWLKELDEWDRIKFIDFVFRTLYLNYDLNQDFLPQFERNCKTILDKLNRYCTMGYKVV